MLLDRHALAVVACTTTLLATCGPSPATPDAGSDAGRDGGRDASVDAAHGDTSRDTGVDARDTGTDAGPTDPVWVRLGGQQDDCILERAEYPERAFSLSWESCGLGCRRAVSERVGAVGGFVDASGVVFEIRGQDGTGADVRGLQTDDGRVLAAWHYADFEGRDQCGIVPLAVGGGRVAFASFSFSPGDPSRNLDSVWVAPLDMIGDTTDPVFQQPGFLGAAIERIFVSASHYAYQVSAGPLALRDEAGAGRLIGWTDFPGTPQNVSLLGGHLLFEMWDDSIRLASATIADAPTNWIDLSPGEVRNFGTDGVDMAWLQGFDYDTSTLTYARLELWTSPYADTVAGLTPRRVGAFPGLYVSTTGGGWYASQADGGELDVRSLADGSRRHWTPPAGVMVLDAPLYVTASDILLTTTFGAYRVDPNTLPIVP